MNLERTERDVKAMPTGFTRRKWSGFLLVWLAISLPFLVLYFTSRRVIINEVRHQAMGVSIAVAAALDPGDLDAVKSAEDMEKPEFRRVQSLLDRVVKSNPDVRYLYVMRRSLVPFAAPHMMQYIVDQSTRDLNGDGVITRDEEGEDAGTEYDASRLPEMNRAWSAPAADRDITPDPPYPDLISGYAPVRDADGKTIAIVGADVTARTVGSKLLAVQIVAGLVWLIMAILVSLVIHLYYQQQEAFDRVKQLSEELGRRNDMLRNANDELAANNARYEQELKLAQAVQQGFLPRSFPAGEHIVFDQYYLTCSILGGDLFDVFDIDEDKVALYMADVAGHGVSAALISGLLKMAISSVRESGAHGTRSLYADLSEPGRVLRVLNDMLVKEIPDHEFITMIYAVIDLTDSVIRFANAGHPWPVHFKGADGTTRICAGEAGMALGIKPARDYPVTRMTIAAGDRIAIYTDGVTEAMNARGEQFGEARLLDAVREHGGKNPSELIKAVCDAIRSHRGHEDVSDDISMLVAQIR